MTIGIVEAPYNALFHRILTSLRIQTTKGQAEFLLDLRKHGDET